MLSEPKDYEEAKKLLMESTDSEYHKRYLMALRLRAALITAVGVAGAFAIGAITNQPEATNAILPNAGLLGIINLLPVLSRKKLLGEIKDGSFFEDKSKEEIIEFAAGYVSDYNNMEKSIMGRK